MLVFDEEAKRILKSEREEAKADAKSGTGLGAIVLIAICIACVAFQVVISVFTGTHFSWSQEVGFACVVYAAAVVAYWINARFSASRERRDARLIRIELKLDRLLDEMHER
jgi:uncharacterized membrane protein